MARRSKQGDDTLYLILESAGSKSLLQSLYEQCEAPVWQLLFSETQWAPYEDESPLVIQTTRDSDLYRWALKGLGKTGELSGLIVESDENLETLLHWARERLTVTLDGVRKGLLRFYDPLVWHSLKPGDIGQQGIVSCVVYLHGSPEEGEWLTNQNPEPVTMAEVPMLEPEQLRNLSLARV
ncbi:DUF4123 domain-containing protein [Marinobacter sp. HN1S83]|uniref:DUF4123 domain-containing protein n=1 Tax=Marinobacter sp. HN1S83 TaxID=3382301 RepID=UPI00387B47DD